MTNSFSFSGQGPFYSYENLQMRLGNIALTEKTYGEVNKRKNGNVRYGRGRLGAHDI